MGRSSITASCPERSGVGPWPFRPFPSSGPSNPHRASVQHRTNVRAPAAPGGRPHGPLCGGSHAHSASLLGRCLSTATDHSCLRPGSSARPRCRRGIAHELRSQPKGAVQPFRHGFAGRYQPRLAGQLAQRDRIQRAPLHHGGERHLHDHRHDRCQGHRLRRHGTRPEAAVLLQGSGDRAEACHRHVQYRVRHTAAARAARRVQGRRRAAEHRQRPDHVDR